MFARGPIVIALIAFSLFVILGSIVSHGPTGAADRWELGVYGEAVPLARFFTSVGRFPTYFALSVAAVIFGLIRRAWLGRVLIAVIGLVVVWQTSDLFKLVFHRSRPPHPILAETSFSYPSGHADLAVFFYGFWAFYVWNSGLPRLWRAVAVTVLLALVLAIGWSRMALGAHFPSDVLGGYAYGTGWLALFCSLKVSRRTPIAT